jgi:NHLM bacteriocin system ABC transporter peptidase/ATP-binding protein
MEATECGAASLAMVLAYHGRWVPLDELRTVCGISRDGSNAGNLMMASKRYGLIPHGWRRSPEKLKTMDLPMIVFWQFQHFFVVEGFAGEKVFVNDPATGPRVIGWKEFDQGFTGIALTFEKGPDFTPGGRRPSVLRSLFSRLGNARAALALIILSGLLLVVPGMAVPALSRTFVDSYLVGQQTDWLPAIVLGLALAVALQVGLTWLQQLIALRLQTKLSVRMAATTFDHLLRLPVAFFTQRSPGELAFRAGLSDAVAQALSGPLTQALLGVFTASFFAVLMGLYDPLLLGVALVTAGLNVVVLKAGARARRDRYARVSRSTTDLAGSVASGVGLIESVKASGGEGDIFKQWMEKLADLVEARQASQLAGVDLTVVPPFLTAISSAAVLGIGALQVMEGTITLGTLVAFQVLMAAFLGPISQLVSLGSLMQTLSGNLGRLDDIAQAPVAPEREPARASQSPDGEQVMALRGSLTLRNVSFGYNPLSPPLIKEFDVHLEPGTRVALVGASGSGKSTVSRLVCGIYEPWSGEVLIDGRPRTAYRRSVLGQGMALVDQEITLFEGTVRDNVTLWDPNVTDVQVVGALHDAAIADDVLVRAGGIWSHVQEGGQNFSGGQRQRLEIARALCRDPALVVLDEATSALDPPTEQLIDLALRRRGCTCLIVAHRLSTIRDADEIIVLERGKVLERGTHETLMASGSGYRRLVESYR